MPIYFDEYLSTFDVKVEFLADENANDNLGQPHMSTNQNFQGSLPV
jgi:hypothetical protein